MTSIFQQLRQKEADFATAAEHIETQVAAWIERDPTAKAVALALQSDLKQAASNAIDGADYAAGAFVTAVTPALETVLTTELAKLTDGLSVPFNKSTVDDIDRASAALVAEIHLFALHAKASLTPVTANPLKPV